MTDGDLKLAKQLLDAATRENTALTEKVSSLEKEVSFLNGLLNEVALLRADEKASMERLKGLLEKMTGIKP